MKAPLLGQEACSSPAGAQRHDAQAIAFEGRQVRGLGEAMASGTIDSAGGNSAPPHSEHERYVRAVDIGIE